MKISHPIFPSQRVRHPAVGRVSVLLAALAMAGWAHAQLAIQSITATAQGGSEIIRVQTSEPLQNPPTGFAIQSPARIALDFAGATNGIGRNLIELNQGNLRSASVVEVGDRTRVVLSLGRAASYRTEMDGKDLLVLLDPVATTSPVAVSDKPSFAESRQSDALLPLQEIDFRRGAEAAGRVVVGLANNQVGVDIRQQGKTLVVDFLKTALPEGLRRRMDVVDFGTPVQIISTTQVGDRVRMVIEPKGNWEHSAYQSDNQFVLEIREQKNDPTKLTQGIGYNGEKLTLNFQNIEVRALLQVVADFTSFNIVTSDSVKGEVTLRLKDVPWDQALDIILQAKGLGMRKTGNVIWIAPKDEIAAREKQDFESRIAVQTLEPVRTQSFQMNYAKAADIAAQLRGEVSNASAGGGSSSSMSSGASVQPTARILSPRGSVIHEPRTNQLFVTDIPSKLEAVQDLLKKLDIPVRQVMIEARIVEASDNFSKSLGVRLGGSDLRGVRGGDAGYSVGGGSRVAIGGSYDAVSTTTTEGSTALTTTNTSFVNLPASSLSGVSPAAVALALFNPSANRFLNLEISALQADGKGKLVSSPRVITADQTKASIEQGVEFPYQAATSSGATQIQFRKAVLKLEVTPQVTPEGGVILDVEVSKDSPGELLTGGQRAINTKRIKTNVLVENGGTVVIGGIFESTESEGVNKVPVLGDLPGVGNLFKSRTQTANKSELLVFLTPRTLSDAVSAR